LDYQRIYREFIADRKRKPRPEGYTERHHIVPRSLGGGDEAANLIDLTAEDHFFAHLLLAKVHGGKQWYALFVMMKGVRRNREEGYLRRARRHYERARSEFIARHGPHMAKVRRGRKHSAATKAKIAKGNSKPKSAEAVANMRAALTGRKLSPEHRAKSAEILRDASRFSGKRHTEQTKARMSAVNQARKLYAERFGGNIRTVTIQQMRAAGIKI
jgi:hypothetical protein